MDRKLLILSVTAESSEILLVCLTVCIFKHGWHIH